MREILVLIPLLCLISCSTHAWYQSAKDAQAAHCRQGPLSEYDDCMKQSDGSYNEYEKERDTTVR